MIFACFALRSASSIGKLNQNYTLIRRYCEPARPASPPGRGQWDSAFEGHPAFPKGGVSYVRALEQTARSDAHGFRSRRPR
jgi:hypothetical protein